MASLVIDLDTEQIIYIVTFLTYSFADTSRIETVNLVFKSILVIT